MINTRSCGCISSIIDGQYNVFFIDYFKLETICYGNHALLLLYICELSVQAILSTYKLSIEFSQLVGGLHG